MTNDRAASIEAFATEIEALLDKRGVNVDDDVRETLLSLAADAELNCRLYWRDKERYHRPSEVARRMNGMASQLEKAAATIDELGPNAIVLIHAASHSELPAENIDPHKIIVGLRRLARDTRAGAVLATKKVRSESIHREDRADRGGRTANEPLRQLIRSLAFAFNHYLQIRPTNVVNAQDGASVSLFDEFARRAFRAFSPSDGGPTQNAAIEKETRRIVSSWDDIELDEDGEFHGLPKQAHTDKT